MTTFQRFPTEPAGHKRRASASVAHARYPSKNRLLPNTMIRYPLPQGTQSFGSKTVSKAIQKRYGTQPHRTKIACLYENLLGFQRET